MKRIRGFVPKKKILSVMAKRFRDMVASKVETQPLAKKQETQ
jgi:hypothetical protein